MILLKTILILYILPAVDVSIYLYNTMDSSSIEQYDCISHGNLFYCRRPTEPISLNRSNNARQCYHNGTPHSFFDLEKNNVSTSTILHQWKSSIENFEQYLRYKDYSANESNGYICECQDVQSFGKNCEYRLPTGKTFADTLNAQNLLKKENLEKVQLYGDVVRYMTLECDSGLLRLDWRDICDGVQQCMSGFDEDNCDKLEFNECENDEYRCMNAMCIPEEYFLDGEFDCLDWSDEIQYYNDMNCPFEGTSIQCDDHFCPPDQFSCGDGQCIVERFKFEKNSAANEDCTNWRNHYFLCETHYERKMWTLPNGRCYEGNDYEELNVNNRSIEEKCEYYLKCALSGGKEKQCPCKNISLCAQQLNTFCSSYEIQYPEGGILAPYILSFYYRMRKPIPAKPDAVRINGTIRCEGVLFNTSDHKLTYAPPYNQMENIFCQTAKSKSLYNDSNLSQYCPWHTLTFDDRVYNSVDICNRPKKCISIYRIGDGFSNCDDSSDEKGNLSVSKMCPNMQRYRFRCSTDEPTCLSVTVLGNSQNDCRNKFDELWLGTSTNLSDMACNKEAKDQCRILQQYIGSSWMLNTTNQTAQQFRIPFRYYCDTFRNLMTTEDENITECQNWWTCPKEQWQCDNGQCIEGTWVLDGEWDCFDASEENAPYNHTILDRNLKVVPYSTLRSRFRSLNKTSPFSKICDLNVDFHCFPFNISNSLDKLTRSAVCMNRDRIGNGHIDCYGAIDERNRIPHCNQLTMLGYNFYCQSSSHCLSYSNHCLDERCTTRSDDQHWCDLRQKSSNCSGLTDTICFNGTCVKNGRCNRKAECVFGEDEYMCDYNHTAKSSDTFYRKDKQFFVKNNARKLHIIQFPGDANITGPTKDTTSVITTPSMVIPSTFNRSSKIAYWCNRGVGVYLHNNSIVCFCPPQYYGDKCQYHTDRIIIQIHLNLSQSIYTVDSDIKIVLKILILFLFNNETITNGIFHVRPATEINIYTKKTTHFLYSRSLQYLQHKQQRYFNQSNIIYDHPYSVRIEIYERRNSIEPILISVWQYRIYFDYLPVFHFAKVLRLMKPDTESNPCSSNPCNSNQECQQILNDKSRYICLCKSNFTGENCLSEDSNCINGYCSPGSLCKPNYRGVLIGNELPYCICPFDVFGEQCHIKYDKCSSTPCQNNGSCFPTSKPDGLSCICTDYYYGKNCEYRKPEVKFYVNESIQHRAAIIQYFHIDFVSFNLILVHQKVYRTLPTLLEYRYPNKTAPEIILLKLYSLSSSQLDIPVELYLLSSHINVASIYATIQINEKNKCIDIRLWNYSPYKYHFICQNNTDLLCFRDNNYLCICEENHTRVECFHYDYTLDQCFHCLFGSRCLQGNRLQSMDFICLCPPCYSGTKCQLNSNSFVFTLDQLFFVDLTSHKQKSTFYLLIMGSLILAFIGLPNNLFSFVTFARPKCSNNGIGQYLYYMSIINQINLSLLVARLVHLSVTITGFRSDPIIDNILCKVFNYLLTCSTRMVYWLISFVATERVYTAVFLKGQWLKQPYVARRLIILICFLVFSSSGYELIFVKSFVFDQNGNGNLCVIDFPITSQFRWMLIHQIISVIHSMLPLLINICCTITMIYVITKSKMHLHNPNKNIETTDMTVNENVNTSEQQDNNHIQTYENNNKHLKTKETRYRLNVLRDVINDNKEVISRPTITLIPSIFALFSLPLFIISFSIGCQNIESNSIRYALIVFYFISFIPQIATFFLYVYPSTLYFNEWRLTRIGKQLTTLRQSRPTQTTVLLSTVKEETLKNFR